MPVGHQLRRADGHVRVGGVVVGSHPDVHDAGHEAAVLEVLPQDLLYSKPASSDPTTMRQPVIALLRQCVLETCQS
ncbi:hypothetical protein Voc01_046160 [Virgisporangium ochraceum]|uniref:Uncharacterized protein n=1 Tax=Virgisporangium ochraceum TaxID=65505 RepID=A0A8J4ECJ6_9ACTN|nr:hypothetical protein Voc01_046160 [Virgisporangium ochraceum]